jgi:sugar/nucleoside kinase (ribokinase family)
MILVVGDIAVDVNAPLGVHPAVGEDCLSPQLSFQSGGMGLNVAMALARLGVSARLVSCVGEDWFGDFALEQATRERIDTTFVQRSPASMSGLFFIAISPDGQRTFFGSRGANAQLRVTGQLRACCQGVTALEISAYTLVSDTSCEFVHQVLTIAKEAGVRSVMDLGLGPSRQIPDRLISAIRTVDTIVANAAEAQALTAQLQPEAAFAALEQLGAREVILKLGAHGCLHRTAGQLCRVPPFDVRVVDTTGAGDAFTAGFMAARLWGWRAEECTLFANACGAAAATTLGAGERLPPASKIIELLNHPALAEAPGLAPVETPRFAPVEAPGFSPANSSTTRRGFSPGWETIRSQLSQRFASQLAVTSETRGA